MTVLAVFWARAGQGEESPSEDGRNWLRVVSVRRCDETSTATGYPGKSVGPQGGSGKRCGDRYQLPRQTGGTRYPSAADGLDDWNVIDKRGVIGMTGPAGTDFEHWCPGAARFRALTEGLRVRVKGPGPLQGIVRRLPAAAAVSPAPSG